jgi:hypothetical protein
VEALDLLEKKRIKMEEIKVFMFLEKPKPKETALNLVSLLNTLNPGLTIWMDTIGNLRWGDKR